MFSKSEKDRKNEIIQNATADEKYRKPAPNTNYKWDEEDFIDLKVTQNGQIIKLQTYRCLTQGAPKSVTIFFHGLNEHMGEYSHLAQHISKEASSVNYILKSLIVVGLDFRGFGKSEGVPGLIENEEQHFKDCQDFIQLIKDLYAPLQAPYFLLGQSMGGMSCYKMGMRGLVDGTILIAPAIMDNTYNSKYGKIFAQWIGGIFPNLKLVPQDDTKHYNKNPQIREDSLKDPYIYKGYLMPGTIKTIVDNMKKLPQTFESYNCPFLVISCGMDSLVDPDVGIELLKRSVAVDKQLIHKENMWHNAIMEEEIMEIMPEIVDWIKKRGL